MKITSVTSVDENGKMMLNRKHIATLVKKTDGEPDAAGPWRMCPATSSPASSNPRVVRHTASRDMKWLRHDAAALRGGEGVDEAHHGAVPGGPVGRHALPHQRRANDWRQDARGDAHGGGVG